MSGFIVGFPLIIWLRYVRTMFLQLRLSAEDAKWIR